MDALPITPETALLVLKAAAVAVLLWQGASSVIEQAKLTLPAWASALIPRGIALGVYLALLYLPNNDRLVGGLAALFAAPLIYDLGKGALAKATAK